MNSKSNAREEVIEKKKDVCTLLTTRVARVD
jgi:hypothetical protein